MALQDKKIMPPPWLAHREIERYSIGWRMGYGEDYIDRFGDWLDTLSPEERTEYRTLFPEPVTWKGWWDDEDSSEVLEHGDFLVDAWQPEGQPKYTRQWLQQEFAAGRKRELCLFWGHQLSEDGQLTKSCLSQWWMEDFYTTADSYLCMEQYMMAAKAELFGDKEIRDQILKCSDQKQIKALGRKVRGFEQKVWDKFKYAIVLLGNWHKFSQNRELREFLLSTGDSVLVEASPYDGGQPLRCYLGHPPRGQFTGGPGPHEVAWTKPAGLCADGGAGRATPSDTERNALRLEHSMGTERNWCASGLRIASPSGIVSVIS